MSSHWWNILYWGHIVSGKVGMGWVRMTPGLVSDSWNEGLTILLFCPITTMYDTLVQNDWRQLKWRRFGIKKKQSKKLTALASLGLGYAISFGMDFLAYVYFIWPIYSPPTTDNLLHCSPPKTQSRKASVFMVLFTGSVGAGGMWWEWFRGIYIGSTKIYLR